MKITVTAAGLIAAAARASAGGLDPVVIVEDTAASSQGILVPVVTLVLFVTAIASAD